MNCDSKAHNLHICYLKAHGEEERIKSLTDKPVVTCRQCGARANSLEFICAAHLKDDAPNVEGGHGHVDLEDAGKPHEG